MKSKISNPISFKLITFALISVLALLPVTAKAQDNTPKNKPADVEATQQEKQAAQEDKKAEIQGKKEDKTKARCVRTTALVREKVSKYQDNRELYVNKFSVLSERIANLIARIKEESPEVDVSELETALATLNEKITALNTLHMEFMSAMEGVEEVECGTGEGTSKEMLGVGRSALNNIKEAVLDIRTFFLEEIKPLMIDLRQDYQEKLRVREMNQEEDKSLTEDTETEEPEDTAETDDEDTEEETSDAEETDESGTEEDTTEDTSAEQE